jgi:hypothetical protein
MGHRSWCIKFGIGIAIEIRLPMSDSDGDPDADTDTAFAAALSGSQDKASGSDGGYLQCMRQFVIRNW